MRFTLLWAVLLWVVVRSYPSLVWCCFFLGGAAFSSLLVGGSSFSPPFRGLWCHPPPRSLSCGAAWPPPLFGVFLALLWVVLIFLSRVGGAAFSSSSFCAVLLLLFFLVVLLPLLLWWYLPSLPQGSAAFSLALLVLLRSLASFGWCCRSPFQLDTGIM